MSCSLHDERKACTNLCKRLAVQAKPTNQTIDGVPRATIARAIAVVAAHNTTNWSSDLLRELRALLGAPVANK